MWSGAALNLVLNSFPTRGRIADGAASADVPADEVSVLAPPYGGVPAQHSRAPTAASPVPAAAMTPTAMGSRPTVPTAIRRVVDKRGLDRIGEEERQRVNGLATAAPITSSASRRTAEGKSTEQ